MSMFGFGEQPQAGFVAQAQSVGLERFEPGNRRRLSAPALRTFAAIADLWGLSEEQRRLVLGFPSRSTNHNRMRNSREHGEVKHDVHALMRR